MKSEIFNQAGSAKSFTFFLMGTFLAALFLFLPFYSWAAPLDDSMLGYWKFDNNLDDSSGDGNTSTIFNGAAYSGDFSTTAFPNSGSIYFPSLSSYVQVSNQIGVSPVNKLTFSMWVKFDQLPADGTVLGGNYSDIVQNQGFGFYVVGSQIYFKAGGVQSSPIAIVLGNWMHLTGVLSSDQVRIYLNGVEIGTLNAVGLVEYSSTVFKLGNFIGQMDDVRLYNRALLPSEIYELGYHKKHTSATWFGNTQSFEDPLSWNTGEIPDPYTIVTIPQTANQPIFSQSHLVAGINIGAGASLDISNWNLFIKDGGGFSNEGELILQNTDSQSIEGFVNDVDSGTVRIEGSLTVNSLKTGTQYYNLTIGGSGNIISQADDLIINNNLICQSGSLTLSGATTVSGDIVLNGGILNASSASPINLRGSWSAISGVSFNHGNGTVHLIGTNQSISGQNIFYNLTKNISTSDTLSFGTDELALDIAGNLSLNGANGNFLNLRSVTEGTHWSINPSGTLNISYLDVMDSNSSSPIDATLGNIVDSGNNFNWQFDVTGPNIAPSFVGGATANQFYSAGGVVSDANNISRVQFNIDMGAEWADCVAVDGNFDEPAEDFICTPVSALSDGIHSFYFNAYDINKNSASAAASLDILIDTIPPVITAFSVPTNSTSLTVSVSNFAATDSNAVAGYLVTETNTIPDLSNSGWSSVPQTSYTFYSEGTKTLYAWAKDSAGNISVSSSATVSVSSADTTPPSISLIDIFPGVNSVVITWSTDETTTTSIEYGHTTSYGQISDFATLQTAHSETISGLSACTVYHFRIISKDSSLNQSSSSDQSFTTGGCSIIPGDTVPPVISSVNSIPDINSAIINWATDEPASSIVEYGTDINYGQNVSDTSLAQTHSLNISGLNACTLYYYKIRSLDASSNEGVALNQSFTTGGCIIPVADNSTVGDASSSDSTISTVSSSEDDLDSCDLDKPGEPEIISVKARDSKSVVLEIDKASGDDDEYEIKYGTASGDYPWKVEDIDDSEIENFIINELRAGTVYYFKVRALNDCEKGDWSDEVSGKTDQENLPITQQENVLPVKTDLQVEPENTSLIQTPLAEDSEIPENEERNFLPSALAYQENEDEKEDEDGEVEKDNAKKSNASVTEGLGVSKVELTEGSGGKKNLKLEGFGPPNTELKVYVYSEDPIVLTVKTDKDGNWSYVLENELEDGEHQVYVTVSEDSGKITQKSNPLVFVKTAQAVSVVSGQAISPTQKAKNNFILLSIVVSLVGLFLALATIGWKMKASKKSKGLEIV
ncbi:MAG: LamG-like jellyroll fold domain-containing protein [Candidatus Moraniibacteriota bacterium]